MKKYIYIVFILIIFIAILSCTKSKSVLKVGLKADYPPFEFKKDNVLTGIDVELAKKVGESLGYSIEFVEMEFDELLPALNNKKIDLAVSAITINQQREQIVDFSIPYFFADQALIANEDATYKIDNMEDISEFKIGCQNGTTGQFFLQYNLVEENLMPWQNLIPFNNNNNAISALINEEIDLLIMDDSAADSFSRIKPIKIAHIIKTDEKYGIAMRQGYSIKNDINTALKQILNSDFWTSLITDYMGK